MPVFFDIRKIRHPILRFSACTTVSLRLLCAFFLSFTMSFTFQVGSTMLELGQQIYFPSYLKIGLYFLSALNFFFFSQSVFISYSLKMNYTTLFSRKIKELRCFQKNYSSYVCPLLFKYDQVHLFVEETANTWINF